MFFLLINYRRYSENKVHDKNRLVVRGGIAMKYWLTHSAIEKPFFVISNLPAVFLTWVDEVWAASHVLVPMPEGPVVSWERGAFFELTMPATVRVHRT